MKSALYEALKQFDERLHMAFPGAMFRLIDAFEGHDVAVEITLPVREITWHERMQLAEIAAALEEEYDVYSGRWVSRLARHSPQPSTTALPVG